MATVPESEFSLDAAEGVSLRQLRDAFANALGNGLPTSASSAAAMPDREALPSKDGGTAVERPHGLCPESLGSTDAPAASQSDAADDDPCEITPASIFEALLFVGNPSNEPLTAERAAELMRGVTPDEIPALVETLNRRYRERGCPYHIVAEGAGYRMTLRPEFAAVRNRFYNRVREARLSQAAIDVLAIVAYRQPITADEVNHLRGRNCNHLLAQLVHRRLLQVERNASSPRVAQYRTTDRFLNVFGLGSIGDLPRSDDVDVK